MHSCTRYLRLLMTVFFLIFSSSLNVDTAFAETLLRIQDPTRPAVTGNNGLESVARSRFKDLILSSTLISSRRSVAIINGRIIELGATLAGAEVVAIQPGVVELRYGGSSHWLHTTAAIEKKSHPAGGILH